MNYQELIDDHYRIDMLATRLERAANDGDGALANADALLDELAALIAAHTAKEDSFVYPDLACSHDAAGAMGLVIEFEALKTQWETYIGTWRRGLAAQDGGAFRDATSAMLPQLRERVMKETSLLYSMALREGLITLQPSVEPSIGRIPDPPDQNRNAVPR